MQRVQTTRVRKGYAGSALMLATAGMVAKLIGAVYRIPLTNILGAEGIGIYQLIFPVYALMLTLSSSAIPTAVARLVSEKIALKDAEGKKKVLKSAMILLVCMGLMTMVVMYVISAPLASLQGNSIVRYGYYAVAPSILFVALSSLCKGWFQGNMNMTPTALSQIVEQVMKMTLGLLLSYYLREKGLMYAVTGALVGLTVSEFISMSVMAILYLRDRPQGVLREHCDRVVALELVKVSLPITVSSLIFPTVQFIDSLLIVNLLTARGVDHATAVGDYGILTAPVNSLINMPIVMTLAFAVAIVPIISSRRALHDVVSIKDKTNLAVKLAVLFGAPCAVALCVLARPLMTVLYPSLGDRGVDLATILLMTSSASVLLLSLQQVYTSILQALGKSLISARNLLITAVIKITLDVVLVYAIGVLGACVSSIAAYSVGMVINTVSVQRLLGKNKKVVKNISKMLLASVIIGIIIYGLSYGIVNEYALIGVSVLISVPIYILAVLAMRVLSEEELMGFPLGKILAKIDKGIRSLTGSRDDKSSRNGQ